MNLRKWTLTSAASHTRGRAIIPMMATLRRRPTWASRFVVLQSFALLLAIAGTMSDDAASSTDSGPPAAVEAVRHDLPILLAYPLTDEPSRPIVDMVVTDGYEAVATWHAAMYRGLVVLYNKAGRWWWQAATSSDSNTAEAWAPAERPGEILGRCGFGQPGPPTADELFMQGLITDHLRRQISNRLEHEAPINVIQGAICHGFDDDIDYAINEEGYDARFYHRANRETRFIFNGGTPERDHRPTLPNTKPLYTFTLGAVKPSIATFSKGDFAIWFPFVIDPSSSYTLLLTGMHPAIGYLAGKLENNQLTFAIPEFSMPMGTMAFGEIDERGAK